MGKKGSWFSAIKRVFSPHSKEKVVNVSRFPPMPYLFLQWFSGRLLTYITVLLDFPNNQTIQRLSFVAYGWECRFFSKIIKFQIVLFCGLSQAHSLPADWIHCSSRSSKTVWMVFWKMQYDYLAFFFSAHSSSSAALCSHFPVQFIFVSKTIKFNRMRVVYDYVLIKFLHCKLVVVKYYSGFGVKRYNFLPKTCKMPSFYFKQSACLWLSVILQGLEKKSAKEKKKGKLKHGETNSFIPLFREPSSIEKIFGDFEREQHIISFRPPIPDEQPKSPPSVLPRVASPRAPSPRAPSPRAASPRAPSPRAPSPRAPSPRIVHHHKEISYRPEPTLRNHHACATKIQAAYRGYTVSFYFVLHTVSFYFVLLEFKQIGQFDGGIQ